MYGAISDELPNFDGSLPNIHEPQTNFSRLLVFQI